MPYRIFLTGIFAFGWSATVLLAQNDPFGGDAPPAKSPGQSVTPDQNDPFGKSVAPATKAPIPVRDNIASCKTADELWAFIESLTRRNFTKNLKQPGSSVRTQVSLILDAARSFIAQYPQDPRAADAKMEIYLAGDRALATNPDIAPTREDLEKLLIEIADSPNASQDIRAHATRNLVSMYRPLAFANPADANRYWDMVNSRIEKFQAEMKTGPNFWGASFVVQLREMQMKALKGTPDTTRLVALINRLKLDPNPKMVEAAKAQEAELDRISELKRKPWDLKFKAIDGQEVDLSQMKGKVVLVYFWSTWDKVSQANIAPIVETYGKLHNQGLEVIGIPLEVDLQSVNRTVQGMNLPWPQYFDGKGKEGPLCKPFGITPSCLPILWIFDKNGFLAKVSTKETMTTDAEKLLNGF